ncbi:dihydrofolate reductase family protein [Dyadobacter sandarakinus]|uniref:Dihydrofolate reductase family protein n=1 Tax=Dyadobacter sandarakinus TaxID=2747268 RepID=A0ABX7I6H0_9BACT|nr:dihydrofolate reductase family protein [Dyadobacter sandarakinus]QRR00783.1 dihydrofolate reductase family protein [Dyadobacter sandarakinus]
MGTLSTFNFITLNGFYKDAQNDTGWHRHGGQESGFASDQLEGRKSILVFGRITYEQMAGWWPTDAALKAMPEVAKGMNESLKIVFSTTMESAGWENTTLIKGDLIEEIKRLKADPDVEMTILGSGSLVAQLADAGLIDHYAIMVDPVALGDGKPLFFGMKSKLDLQLVDTRTFSSGVILLNYVPMNVHP